MNKRRSEQTTDIFCAYHLLNTQEKNKQQKNNKKAKKFQLAILKNGSLVSC